MPTVSNTTLTLTTVNTDTTIDVTYDATYTEFEQQLAGLGMTFSEVIDVMGVDVNILGKTIDTVLATFPTRSHDVKVGGPTVIQRSRTRSFTRASLQEDPKAGDDDEIRCRIRINSVGLPPEFTPDAFTVQQPLLG